MSSPLCRERKEHGTVVGCGRRAACAALLQTEARPHLDILDRLVNMLGDAACHRHARPVHSVCRGGRGHGVICVLITLKARAWSECPESCGGTFYDSRVSQTTLTKPCAPLLPPFLFKSSLLRAHCGCPRLLETVRARAGVCRASPRPRLSSINPQLVAVRGSSSTLIQRFRLGLQPRSQRQQTSLLLPSLRPPNPCLYYR